MFDKNDLGAALLANPAATQYKFLTELESRTNGAYSIADPNNGFCLLGEFCSSMTAQFVRQEDARYNALYAIRSTTAEDLYASLSDYAYVNLTASPASCKFQVLFNKQVIIDSAVKYDDTYDAHIIPKETIITVAGMPFTLYYPIMILVNRTTDIITVQYDINTPDKLMPMSTNLPYQVTERTINGVTYLAIVFDAYQYVRQVYTETIDSSSGYYTIFSYTDKFYAAKVEWYNSNTGNWVELTYSLSQQNYDTSNPTAILVFNNDSNQVSVRIPQVYFTSGAISGRIRTTIYSTKGAIDVTLSQDEINSATVDFMPNTSTWSGALAHMTDGLFVPYDTTRIEGGGDPVSFNTFRNAVINQTIYDQVPISNLQLEAAVAKYGFSLSKYRDNLADARIFYAGATLSDPVDNSPVPVVASKVILDEPYNTSTILAQSDGTVTILPTTVFKYDRVGDSSRPLTDGEVYGLSQLSKDDLVAELNTNIYTRQPYHLWLDRNVQYPEARAYNLVNPKMTSLLLQRENIHSTVMMNVVSVLVEHQDDGTGGYKFYIYVERSTSLPVENVKDCKLILQTQSRSGNTLTFEASYSATGDDGEDIYTFSLPTTYRLYSDNFIQIDTYDYNNARITTDLSLNSKWTIKTLVGRSVASSSTDDANLNTDIPYSYLNNYIVVSQQLVTISLGESLEDYIFNATTTTWGDIKYQKYDTDIPYTYDQDIYLTDRKGYLLTRVVTDSTGKQSVASVKLFNKGDSVLSKSEASYNLAKDAASGSRDLTLTSSEGILIGQVISGTNIRASTIVTHIDGNVITISSGIMNDLSAGSGITAAVTYIDSVATADSAKGSNVITIGNSTNVTKGMTVAAFGVVSGSVVTDIGDGTITIDQALTDDVKTGDTIAVFYKDGSKSYQYRKGDTILDGKGNPVTDGSRTNSYGIMVIQFDARLYESEDPNDQAYVASLPSLLKSKSSVLDPIRSQLIEQTKLYYLPFRTLGDATYGIGDGRQITLPLEMSYSITYYVSEATKSDATVQSVITSSTINTVNAYVQKGRISTSDLSSNLKSLFSGLVDSVNVSGIDNTSTNNVVIDTKGASPSIEKVLYVNGAGQKALKPNIIVTYQVSPS